MKKRLIKIGAWTAGIVAVVCLVLILVCNQVVINFAKGKVFYDIDSIEYNKVGLFAYLHDSCRVDDGEDIYHGTRAAEWIETLKDNHLKGVSDEEIGLLQEACYLHTAVAKTGNPTIDACFDADRLDLWRVGIIPDPDRMATEKGRIMANNTNYEEFMNTSI